MGEIEKYAEIVGGGFMNRGAEMMVDVCSQQLRSWQGPWRAAVDWSTGSYEDRAARELKHVVDVKRLGKIGAMLPMVLPSAARRRLGIVGSREIDVVLDVAGFAYSDQWGPGPARAMAERAVSRSKQGERYFLLPQAFGPFEDEQVASSVKSYLDRAELIFVRDRVSLEHVEKLMGTGDERISLCPDFTCLAKPTVTDFQCDGDYACVVPNCRMVDPRHGNSAGEYEEMLLEAIRQIDSLGLRVVLMNHEGAEDLAIVKRLDQKSPVSCKIVRGGRGLELKAILGGAQFAVASRFHAIVSALIQGVPVIGTGWSHKYKELFGDFGIGKLLITVGGDHEELVSLVKSMGQGLEYEGYRGNIAAGLQDYRSRSEALWGQLRGRMESGSQPGA